jgi:heme/copper-type cytochrome/quinol oxidase subunit 4
MHLPRNVSRFEVLLYISLMLDALSVAVQDRTPTVDVTDAMIMVQAILNGVVILLLLYFVYLAARGRRNWPRWIIVAALVLSAISLVSVIGEKGMTLDAGIEIISCALTTLGLYYSFTGDAQGWFNA